MIRDREKQREYSRRYRERNPGRAEDARARWRASNVEQERDRKRADYLRLRDGDPKRNWVANARGRTKKRAAEAGLDFDLSVSYLLSLLVDACPIPICGHVRLSYAFAGNGGGPQQSSASIDRIDPNGGYVRGNVWIVCNRCNQRMSNNTSDQLRIFAEAKDRASTKYAPDVHASPRQLGLVVAKDATELAS